MKKNSHEKSKSNRQVKDKTSRFEKLIQAEMELDNVREEREYTYGNAEDFIDNIPVYSPSPMDSNDFADEQYIDPEILALANGEHIRNGEPIQSGDQNPMQSGDTGEPNAFPLTAEGLTMLTIQNAQATLNALQGIERLLAQNLQNQAIIYQQLVNIANLAVQQ